MAWDFVQRISPSYEAVIEEMRTKLAENFGVTVQGTNVTVRWGKKHLSQVSMVITDVTTPYEDEQKSQEYEEYLERLAYLKKRVRAEKGNFDVEAALYYLETGETPQ